MMVVTMNQLGYLADKLENKYFVKKYFWRPKELHWRPKSKFPSSQLATKKWFWQPKKKSSSQLVTKNGSGDQKEISSSQLANENFSQRRALQPLRNSQAARY